MFKPETVTDFVWKVWEMLQDDRYFHATAEEFAEDRTPPRKVLFSIKSFEGKVFTIYEPVVGLVDNIKFIKDSGYTLGTESWFRSKNRQLDVPCDRWALSADGRIVYPVIGDILPTLETEIVYPYDRELLDCDGSFLDTNLYPTLNSLLGSNTLPNIPSTDGVPYKIVADNSATLGQPDKENFSSVYMNNPVIGDIIISPQTQINDTFGSKVYNLLDCDGTQFDQNTYPELYIKLNTDALPNIPPITPNIGTYKIVADNDPE